MTIPTTWRDAAGRYTRPGAFHATTATAAGIVYCVARDVPVRLARLPIADPPTTGTPHAWTHRHTGACDSPQAIPCYFHDAGNCRAAHRCPARRPVRARHAVPSKEPRP